MAPNQAQIERESPRGALSFRAFHRQMRGFGDRKPRMSAKYMKMSAEYNILWFVVDMHHRERYFFICGPKQFAAKSGLTSR